MITVKLAKQLVDEHNIIIGSKLYYNICSGHVNITERYWHEEESLPVDTYPALTFDEIWVTLHESIDFQGNKIPLILKRQHDDDGIQYDVIGYGNDKLPLIKEDNKDDPGISLSELAGLFLIQMENYKAHGATEHRRRILNSQVLKNGCSVRLDNKVYYGDLKTDGELVFLTGCPEYYPVPSNSHSSHFSVDYIEKLKTTGNSRNYLIGSIRTVNGDFLKEFKKYNPDYVDIFKDAVEI